MKKVEDYYWENDGLIEERVERFIITNSSDSEDSSDDADGGDGGIYGDSSSDSLSDDNEDDDVSVPSYQQVLG